MTSSTVSHLDNQTEAPAGAARIDLTQVNQRIADYRTEMVSTLSELISIPSVAERTEGIDPFGPHVQEAYACMLAKAGESGFVIFDADHFGGHIDYPGFGIPAGSPDSGNSPEPADDSGSTGTGKRSGSGSTNAGKPSADDSATVDAGILGIVGHLDGVPAGDVNQWEFDPYGGTVTEDGYVCGRGAMDDKGPVVASFYAMKALQDCGFRPQKTIRLILGLDEEKSWDGMKHYLAFVPDQPDCGFTPDADFPVIHGEKGILVFDIARKFSRTPEKGLQLRKLEGGTAANAVPDSARAVVYDDSGAGYEEIRSILTALRESSGWKIHLKGIGKSLEIRTQGVSAHGSKPEKGLNAISILMHALGYLRFASDDVAEFIRFYNEHIGFDMHGERIGCAFADEPSGQLVWNTGKIDLDKGSARLTINVRYPVTIEDDQIYDGITEVIAPFDLGIIKGRNQPPIYYPADDPRVTALMDVYRQYTGDAESQPLVIGGGTYARAFDGVMAFGARFPGKPSLEHQANERISIDDLLLLAKIYAGAIVKLAGEADPVK